MEALKGICLVRDPQIASLRSLASRRRRALVRYAEFLPPVFFLANFCICAYLKRTLLETESGLGELFLAESCFTVAFLFLHGGTFLEDIIARSRLMGVSSSSRLRFAIFECGAHPLILAQVGSLLLLWLVLFHANLFTLAISFLGTSIWYGSVVASATVVFLAANRFRIPLPIVGTILGTILFIVITGPTVISGEAPYASLPLSGWTTRALFSAMSGQPWMGLLWLLPSIAVLLLVLPIGVKKG